MKTYERFLNYVRIHTASSEDSSSVPTTERQFDLANLLVKELHAIGVENARVDDKCYVYASVAATPGCESCPAIGFIAHMDTVPDFSGENVQPRIIENYDGGDVPQGIKWDAIVSWAVASFVGVTMTARPVGLGWFVAVGDVIPVPLICIAVAMVLYVVSQKLQNRKLQNKAGAV